VLRNLLDYSTNGRGGQDDVEDLVHRKGRDFAVGTIAGNDFWPHDTLQVLAETGRMTTLGFRATRIEMDGRTASHLKDDCDLRKDWTGKTIRASIRVATYLVFESALQSNLKVTVLGAAKAAGKSAHVDGMTCISIALGLVMTLYNLYKAGGNLMNMYTKWSKYQDQTGSEDYQSRPGHEVSVNLECKRGMRCAVVIFIASSAICSVLVAYALVKTYFVFVCQGLWNISGCVDTTSL
jgi:hypothetical protein